MNIVYQTGILFYVWAIRLAALFHPKARLWVSGRKNIRRQLAEVGPFPGKTVWVHCASLGEFEQGRPVMEAIKKQYPDTRIILTFFSPSGYEVRKNYAGADFVFYLPADLPRSASRFYDCIRPDLGIIIKYEFWQGYLHEAARRDIPLVLVSGIFRKNMPFFKPYGAYFRKGLQAFRHLFVQNRESHELLYDIGLRNITTCGDTRLDRVLEAVEKRVPIPAIAQFKANTPLWVCGSTWPIDDSIIAPVAKKLKGRLKVLLVPHDIHPDYLDKLIADNPTLSFIRYSSLHDHKNLPDADILVLDTIGVLSSAYAYADFVYVGGGFGKAVHNTMEPAAYGVPVLFGPHHHKFMEIAGLMKANGGLCVYHAKEMEGMVDDLLTHPEKRDEMGKAARRYVETHAGATNIIMDRLRPFL